MKNFLLILLLAFLQNTQADTEGRRDQILTLVDEEMTELLRLSKQQDHSNPSIQLRLAELYLEKARVIKEKENDRFLSMSANERNQTNKNSIFATSTKFFSRANDICLGMLKRFKNFKDKGDVYFILAYNAKEFNKTDKAKDFFSKALDSSNKNSKIYAKSSLALAEIYFNEKKYSKAAELYEDSLEKKRDRWWTKDALNLAWCYSKLGKDDRAISLAKEVYEKSSSGNFIDMRSQVMRDIALFYAQAEKIDEGISFYKSVGEDLSSRLVKLARLLLDEGRPTQAEKVLKEAKRVVKGQAEIVEANLILLNLFEKYGKFEQHINVIQEMVELNQNDPLESQALEVVKFQTKKVGAIIQRQVVGNTYAGTPAVRKAKAALAARYYDVLAKLEGKAPQENYFIKAETSYSVGNYDEALESYSKSYEQAKSRGDKKHINLSLEGMLATLAQDSLSEKSKNLYLAPTYTRYLNNNPTSNNAPKIFQKLFKIHLDQKDAGKAEEVLEQFKRAYPQDEKIQEAMVANIMELHRDTKNTAEIVRWMKKIQAKEYKVSPEYAKKLRSLALTMQFENAEKATTKGEKKSAMVEYFRIFKDPSSSKAAQKNAAYNIAVLFFELNNLEKTYEWGQASLKFMDAEDTKKFDASFLAMSSALFERRDFEKSAKLSEVVLEKICRTDSVRKKIFFKNAVIVYLADNKIDEAEKLIEKAQSCDIPASFIQESQADILKNYAENERWSSYTNTLAKLEDNPAIRPQLIRPMFTLRKIYADHGDDAKARALEARLLSYYTEAKKQKKEIPLEGLDVIASFGIISLEKEVKKLNNVTLAFPEDVFNKALKEKLQQLEVITTRATQVFDVGSGIGVVKAYQYLVESYQRTVKEIRDFSPEGKSPEYVASFKKSMEDLTRPILAKGEEYLKDAQEQIEKNAILSHDNYWFFASTRVPLRLEYRFIKNGVIMDRGGQR